MPSTLDVEYRNLDENAWNSLFDTAPQDIQVVSPEDNTFQSLPNAQGLEALLPLESETPPEPPRLPTEGALITPPVTPQSTNLDDLLPEDGVATTSQGEVDLLRSHVDFMIENGLWEDFEGRNEMELDADSFAELAKEQEKWSLERKWNSTLEEVGPEGRAILEYKQSGGDPKDMLKIFQEQKAVAEYDKTTEEGKKQFLAQYYKDVKKLDKSMIDRQIKALTLDDELDTEIASVDAEYTRHFQVERERLQQEQTAAVEVEKQRNIAYETAIKNEIASRSLSPQERQLLSDSLLTFDYALPNGHVTNRLYGKLAEIQSDPKRLISLADYFLNEEAFMERINQKAETKATNKAFNIVKNNAATSRKTGTGNTVQRNQPEHTSLW